jgi:DNA repair protein RecO (recombination protein O)
MQRSQDQGIILHIRPYRETSAIISILSKQHGLLRGVLRGYKRSSSKQFSSVRPLSLVEFSFSGTGDLKTMFNMELTRSFARVPAMLCYSMLLVEVCHKLLPPEQEEEEVYLLLQDSLKRLDSNAVSGATQSAQFIVEFMLRQGYELEKSGSSLDHLLAKSENELLSREEEQSLLEQVQVLLRHYYPNKVIRSFNLLLSNRNEARR